MPQLNLEKIKSQQTDYYKKNIRNPSSTPSNPLLVSKQPKSADTLDLNDESWTNNVNVREPKEHKEKSSRRKPSEHAKEVVPEDSLVLSPILVSKKDDN